MAKHLRIVALATAQPPYCYSQADLLERFCDALFGPGWAAQPEAGGRVQQVMRLFRASRVDCRQFAVDPPAFYSRPRTTGERMAEYARSAYPLARAALEACLDGATPHAAGAITDFVVVSSTGYTAPGLDILLARDLGMPCDVRRVVIGHMGCFGALVGLREARAALRANAGALVALLTVELCSLHWMRTLEPELLTAFALFGDAAAAVLLSADPQADGPELVGTYCATDYGAAGQMSWTITDEGFAMGLSSRVPVTLRRNVVPVVERLLAPHGLTPRDVTHWLVHPGGPTIVEAVRDRLHLSEEQVAPSWQALREHGNCSSATVLLMLDALLRSGRTRPGEWGVMMAFGFGLTLETCLLRF